MLKLLEKKSSKISNFPFKINENIVFSMIIKFIPKNIIKKFDQMEEQLIYQLLINMEMLLLLLELLIFNLF